MVQYAERCEFHMEHYLDKARTHHIQLQMHVAQSQEHLGKLMDDGYAEVGAITTLEKQLAGERYQVLCAAIRVFVTDTITRACPPEASLLSIGHIQAHIQKTPCLHRTLSQKIQDPIHRFHLQQEILKPFVRDAADYACEKMRSVLLSSRELHEKRDEFMRNEARLQPYLLQKYTH